MGLLWYWLGIAVGLLCDFCGIAVVLPRHCYGIAGIAIGLLWTCCVICCEIVCCSVAWGCCGVAVGLKGYCCANPAGVLWDCCRTGLG